MKWASQDEIQERWYGETITHRPVTNYMEDGLWDSFVIVGQAMRDFLAVVATETDRQVSRFYNWLDLTEQIHSASLHQ
jgi:hypothetical protein